MKDDNLLKCLLLCKDTSQNENGSVNILGVFNKLEGLRQNETSREEFFYLLGSIHLVDDLIIHQAQIRLKVPNYEQEIVLKDFQLGVINGQTIVDFKIEIFFNITQIEGAYYFRLYLDDYLIGQTDLTVDDGVLSYEFFDFS